MARTVAAGTAAVAQWWRRDGDGLTLELHVQPGARRTEVDGLHGGALKIRLAAPPIEGRANAELLRYLAEAFAVPQRQVELLRGTSSRRKAVRIGRPSRHPAWWDRVTAA